MTRDGRPLRFLVLVMTGWVGARAVMLWPGASVAVARDVITPRPAAALRATEGRPVAAEPPYYAPFAPAVRPTARLHIPAGPAGRVPTDDVHLPSIGLDEPSSPGLIAGLPIPLSSARPQPQPQHRSRLFGSAWAVARGGNGLPAGVPGVQLGGSQAGVRLGYALREDRRLAVVARVSSPLGRGMREGAVGIEWQPTRLPVRLVAEQRFALGPGRGGPTLAAVGGVGPRPLAAGFRLEAYVQAGMIARSGTEGFADGALRVARPVAVLGGVKIDLGGGTWGAAQRGATRLDVGPSLSAVVPVGPQPVRLSLDWRQRVAGNAAPGSGLVATLGADF